jgi:sugar O-acyltransferase (sialic acid O-acetyltransferase NeuD family)
LSTRQDCNLNSQVVVIGAGMHAHVVIDLLFDCGYTPLFMVDKLPNSHVYRGIGCISEGEISLIGKSFIVAVGDNNLRAQLARQSFENGGKLIEAVVHPSVVKSPTSSIDVGTIALPGSIIGANTKVGKNSILNSKSVVEHDCKVGDFAHIGGGAVLGGAVSVGDFAQIGLGAVIYPSGTIGAKSIVGAGSVVVRDVAPSIRVFGNPAREA